MFISFLSPLVFSALMVVFVICFKIKAFLHLLIQLVFPPPLLKIVLTCSIDFSTLISVPLHIDPHAYACSSGININA